MAGEQKNERIYRVVKNNRDQYAMWIKGRELPNGWSDQYIEGDIDHCLSHLETIWANSKPRNLKEAREKSTTVNFIAFPDRS